MKRNAVQKFLSIILCLAMVVSYLPAGLVRTSAAVSGVESREVDNHTLDQWKQYFGVLADNANNVSLTTEFAGGVWTDKSVFTPNNIPASLTSANYNGTPFPMTDKGDNFLVALSAIASNKEIAGYSTIPTDTVLILDLSSSMRYTDDNGGSAVDELVEATNKAIADLLALNKNNRVAVVIYAGNTNKSFSNANGLTQITLPLDSYTTTSSGVYLTSESVGNSRDRAIEVHSGVKNSAGQRVSARFEVSTGTYMQDGLYEAMKLLLNADPVVESGIQAGTTRMPIMVLMTDGEPTLATSDYNGNDARTDLGTTDLYSYDGSTGTHSHRDTIAFVTSLTAAFAKKTVEAHYGTSGLMYTLPYGNSVLNREEALSVLNPVQASSVQNSLWNSFLNGEEVRVYRTGNRPNYNYITVKNSTAAGETLTAADRLYVDKYFPASNDDAMLRAFEDIVEEIIIQSKYYPTYVEKDHDHDGYLTFVDKIGAYMEVSDVKGIEIGSRLFSGAALAAKFVDGSFGSMENPTSTGSDLIRSIMTRLNIADSETAKALAVSAYSHGQLSYQNDQNFSHYLGWFSDASGNYVDFWHEDMTAEQIATAVSKGATHTIKSYIFLGDTTVVPGVSNTDMMFMSVRVATAIDTKDTIVTWRIPASLVPAVTYQVEVEVDSEGNIARVIDLGLESGSADAPIRLLYEVELRSDITDWNMAEKVDASYTAANGYVFYSNKWNANASDTTANTYSHFEPSIQNERYYYTQDTLVMVKTGTDTYAPYTGSAQPSGDGYWHSLQVFEKLTDGTLRIHTHYEPISSEAVALAELSDGQWFVPKDTVHRYYDYEISGKEPNRTETMAYSDHPFVVKQGSHYYTYSTQGNNGKLTVTPATGIKLTKNLAAGFTSDEAFTFVLEGNIANAMVVRLNANGEESGRTALAANGEVQLVAGETVYIVGLTPGSYTISEKVPTGAGYHVSSVSVNNETVTGNTATLTLADRTITPVLFINDKQGHGSLIVSKDVNYPDSFVPYEAHNNKTFTVHVAFTGNITGIVAPDGAVKDGNTYTITLKDGQSVTFSNIPDGTTYTVTESGLTAGYTNTDIRYSNSNKAIVPGVVDQAHVVNTYAPASVNVNLKIQGTKTVTGGWPAGAAFTVRLWEITDLSSGNTIDTGLTATVTSENAGYQIDMSSITFDKEGTYYFRLSEDIPENRIPDMAYDRTEALFYVIVTDKDADGKLEIADVQEYMNTQLSGNVADGYVVTKNFNNVVTKDIVYLDVQKTVVNAFDASVTYNAHLADIGFGLFETMNSAEPAYYVLSDGEGKAQFAVPVTQASLGSGKVFYLRELAPALENRVVGMHYDESWRYAVRITWNSEENKAVTEYAAIENGQVGAFQAYVPGQTVFGHTNTYEPNVQSTPAINLSGNKTLNGGNDLGGRTFSFSLYKTTAAFVIQGSALQTVQNNGNAITFAGITFDTPGLHYLSVKEDHTAMGGITTDENHYHITILVEKYADAEGVTRLRVAEGYPRIVPYGSTASVEADGLNFNNLYTVSGETSIQISGTKTLTGRLLLNGEFSFKLEEVADANGTALTDGLVLKAENGSATNNTALFQFAPITYTEEGVHYYKVTEEAGPAGTGVTYSTASFIVKVEVKDSGLGSLSATQTVVNGDAVAFVNSYRPSATSTEIYSVKELSGKVLTDGQFEFILTETEADFTTVKEGGINRTVKNNAHGVILFGPISFWEEGTHYYVVKEKIPADAAGGITYDETEYRVTIRVVDNQNGRLVTFSSADMVVKNENGTTVIPTSSIVFYNKYTVSGNAAVELEGEKTLSGKDLKDGMFTFELYKTGDSYAIDGITPETATNEDGSFRFRMEYTAADVGTTFYYVVREQNAGQTIDGMAYSEAVYQIAVLVEDNGNGGIKTTVTSQGLTPVVNGSLTTLSGLDFANVYESSDTSIEINGAKELTGKDLKDGQFEFTLTETEADFTTVKAHGVTATVKNDANGRIHFTNIFYKAEGTFYYVIREKNGGKTIDGITYDGTEYRMTVRVVDDHKGSLVVSSTMEAVADQKAVPADAIVFHNKYTVSGSAAVELEGEKTLSGKDLKDGMFTFELYKTGSTYAIDGITPETVTNENGGFSFQLEYTSKDVGTTFYYVVREKNGGQTIDGITYSDVLYKISVLVEDNGNGGVKTTVTSQGLTPAVNGSLTTLSGLDFANSYKFGGTSTEISSSKELSGKVLEDGQFEFTLTETEADFTTAKENGIARTVKNDGEGQISFGQIFYEAEGTYYYVVKEKIPAELAGGITYDETEYRLTVRVVDNQKGSLTVSSTMEMVVKTEDGQKVAPADAIVFHNKYTVSGNAAVALEGEKTLVGKELKDGMFTFELYKTGSTYAIDGITPETVTNENGGFSFLLEYTPKDVGTTFYYVVREKNGGQTIDGITYSDALYKLSVLVEDNGNGGIKTTVTSQGLTPAVNGAYTALSGLDFTNTYRITEGTLDLTVEKTMTGDSKDPSGFQFGLYDDLNADPVMTITSDKDGVVSFQTISIPAEALAGSPYTFFIREILPVVDGQTVTEKDGITYDSKVYTVILTVTDNGTGALDVSYTVDGAEVDETTYRFAFTNSYEKPPAETPPQGDDLMLVLWAVLLIGSAAAITALVVSRKKFI